MGAWLSAKDAAELAGVSKSAILKAIHAGRLSADRDDAGAFRVQVVEVDRVYGVGGVSAESTAEVSSVPRTEARQVDGVDAQIAVLLATKEQLEARLRERDDVINDLRQRLDTEAEERRRLSLLLTDKDHAPQPRGWWGRLWRGGNA